MASGSGTSSDGSSTPSSGDGGSRKRSVHSTNQTPFRSVVDFDTDEQLREAMLSFISDVEGENNGSCSAQLSALLGEINEGQPIQKVVRSGELQAELASRFDWVIPKFDEETQNPQSVKDELQRLQVLKSYLIMDADREEAFDRITQLASRIFDVPIATVSLIDLGRQFYLSAHGFEKYGFGDVRDVPRPFAFCSHTIISKSAILVVPDMSKDFRYMDNPFVTGPPCMRFYAGASLVTPEGYRIGTVCLLDTVARPNGLSEEELSTLTDLAEMTMKVMIDRRFKLNKKTESPSQLMAYTAHDMLAPLKSVHLSLSILNSDPSISQALGEHQLELLNSAASCSELMIRICMNMFEGSLQDKDKLPSEVSQPAANNTLEGNVPLTNLKDLVKSLKMTVDPIPKKVPCIVTLDKDVPNVIVGDDLKLFRCAVNLLTNAIDRTMTGIVHLTIRWDGDTLLLFECEDTGPDIPIEEYPSLFQRGNDDTKSRVGLSSIAMLMDSLEGEYGFRPKDVDGEGNIITDAQGLRSSGSIFWFSIPLLLPEMLENPEPLSSPAYEPYPVSLSSDRSSSQQHEIQYQANTQTMGGEMYYADTVHRPDMYRPQPSSTNFVALNVVTSDNDNDVMDELGKLALDLNASLTDFEPYPVNTENYKTITPNTVRQRRALVIDDSLVVRRSLAQALNQLGFEVTQAGDGSEGLLALQKTLYDIVLCDFMMPVMDGVSCVSQYRNWEKMHRSWDKQLIIGISANAGINNNGQGIHAGMNAFLPKPITVKTLSELDCSSEVVQRTRQLDEFEGTTAQNYFDASIAREQNVPVSLPSHQQRQPPPRQNTTSCLIAADVVSAQSNPLPQQLESMGWNVVIVHDGIDCLELLKMQQWAAVLVEDNLTQLSGLLCISNFRKWEGLNAVAHRQKNVFYVCDGDIPSPADGNSWIQPPIGFDGVLSKPVPWIDLQCMLMRSSDSQEHNIVNVGLGYSQR